MSTFPDQQQITVFIDSELLEQVDQWTSDHTIAIAEGLRLWCNLQAEKELQKSAQARKQRHDRDETGWLV